MKQIIKIFLVKLTYHFLVVLDGTSLYRKRCVGSYSVNSDNPNDYCCPETPLQGSYYCSLHTATDHSNIIQYESI